jgi:ABC-2 type transport system permease protein
MFVVGLWAAPIYGWLLLASAAAKRSPFMMAVIPPAIVVMIESWLLGSHRLLDSLYARVPGDVVGIKELGFHFQRYSEILFGHPSSAAFWTGLIVAGVFLAAAVWLRNNRFEI